MGRAGRGGGPRDGIPAGVIPPGGGSTWIPNWVTDVAAPSLTVNVASANAANAAGLTYNLPADTTNVPRAIFARGFVPTVAPPAGWKLWSPIAGALLATNATFTYPNVGDSWVWSADFADLIYYPL